MSQPMGARAVKKRLKAAMLDGDPDKTTALVSALDPQKAVSPLFSLCFDPADRVRWGAVFAMGHVVDRLARRHMESARVVMRRIMWNLNDESGGIGWGMAEAMGEICAKNAALAGEYGRILVSFIRPGPNDFDHLDLIRGAVWGVVRLCRARPDAAVDAGPLLSAFLTSDDPFSRGLAAWGLSGPGGLSREDARRLPADSSPVTVFWDGKFHQTTVGRLAKGEAL